MDFLAQNVSIPLAYDCFGSLRIKSSKLNKSVAIISIIPIDSFETKSENNHSSQLQRTQTIQGTSENSKELHVADVKRGKT